MVVDVGNDTEVGLNCDLEEALGVEDTEEVVGRESLGVAEARMANSIAICDLCQRLLTVGECT